MVACGLCVVAPSAVFGADVSAPTQPGVVTVSSVTASTAVLKWGGSTDNVGIEGYRIYRGPAGAADTALALVATTDAVTSYTATSLRSGYAYKFAVMAIDAANNKSAVRTTTLTTGTSTDTTAPAAPSSTSVALTAFSSTRIDLVWAASSSSDVAFYEVRRDGAVVGTIERPNGQRFSDNGLSPSSSHSYTVIAVDSAGNRSAATTAKTATTTATGTVKIARGPYLSKVTGQTGVISWWSNIPTGGSVSINGRTVNDPAGTIQHHAVTVTGLSAGTSYPYTVSSGTVSATGILRTAAAAGQSFSFAAIGDFGGGSPGEQQNATNIAAAGTDFIQTLGDNIYPAAGLPDPDFSTVYSDFDARFYKQFGPVLKSQAFFPANGNKEYYGDGAFWNNFPMPGNNHSWYSYDWGNAHILVLDSEQPMDTASAQYAFAASDLGAHQGGVWRIVAIQRPAYSSATANSSSTVVRQYLVPLFQAQKVDLVLSGNSHNYERTFPLVDGNPVASGGVTYVVSGGGGNGFNTFQLAQPAYSAFREATYSEFVKVTVSPTSLVAAGVRADTNTVFDSVTLSRGDNTPPTAPTGLTGTSPSASTVALSWSASSDNTGVTGYEIYRGTASTPIATTTGTTVTDTGLSPSTTYSYIVKAVDATGNRSAPSNTATVSTQAGGTTITLTPIDDATIDPATTATPSASRVKVDGSAPVNDLLVKFSIPSTCTPTGATLLLTVGSGTTDPSPSGGSFFATSPTDPNAGWTETGVTWAGAPAKDTAIPSVSLGPVAAGQTYPVTVTSLLPTGGVVTIRASSASGDGAGYFSKEGSTTSGPRLQLSCK
jgi:chitodextrinase